MGVAAFDTLKFVRRLRAAGVPEQQAEAEADAIKDVFSETLDNQLATKADIIKLDTKIDRIHTELDTKIDRLDSRLTGRINLLHWMVAFNLALTSGVLWKLFTLSG